MGGGRRGGRVKVNLRKQWAFMSKTTVQFYMHTTCRDGVAPAITHRRACAGVAEVFFVIIGVRKMGSDADLHIPYILTPPPSS